MVDIYTTVLAFIWAFLLSVFAVPSIIQVAHSKNLLDVPNLRTVHHTLTPRLGGVAIFAGFISSLVMFGALDFGVQEVVAGAIVIFFLGLKDDLVTVSAFKKFFVQVLAACIIMFPGGVYISDFQGIFGIGEVDPGIGYAMTFLVMIGLTNAVNLIDGLDGLAASIISVICLLFGFSFFQAGSDVAIAYGTTAFCLLGSLIGFLRYNFPKAIIFMGDTGSLICGFIIAVLAVQFVEIQPVEHSAATAMAVVFIPVLDTLRVFFIRIINGVSPFAPDKNHIHHRLTDVGMSQLGTVLFLVTLNLFVVSVAMFFPFESSTALLFILFFIGVLFSVILELVYFRKKKFAEAESV